MDEHAQGDKTGRITVGIVVAVAGAFIGLLVWDWLHPTPCDERYTDPQATQIACEIERLKAQIRELEAQLEEYEPPEIERPRP